MSLFEPNEDDNNKEKGIEIGQLISLEWKVGVSTSSNTCRNLNTPFVSIFLRVRNSDHSVQSSSFELTIPEFKNLAKNFNEISKLFETL